jgi:CelD/BcsL family acetyltransferase involved in cellulose biosynthesis
LCMKVEVFIGSEAEKLLENIEFCEGWRRLSAACPWGSVFQELDFVTTWYSTYRSQYRPVIVTGVTEDNEKAGLFTLATCNVSGELVVAGDRYTEYAAWLADPRYGDEFIESAIGKLSEKFPNRSLTLLFALPTLPVEWLNPGNRFSSNCHLRIIPRGLMAVGDGSSFKESLRKRNQNKINRLKRIGELRFDRIEDPEEFQEIIDEILSYQTFRLRAVYNITDPENDPLKKTFLTNLLRLPDMLNVTVLRVGDKFVSGQIHMHNRDQVLLGLITHSPFYSKFSPGTLHLLMLGLELAKRGIPIFDLTPGGEYKDRYATDQDQAYILKIFFNRAHCFRYKLGRKISESIKSLAQSVNILPAQAREAQSIFLDHRKKFAHLKITSILSQIGRMLKRRLWHTEELLIYTYDLGNITCSHDPLTMKRDHLPDLLVYRPMEPWQPPVNKFLKMSMKNIENGHHVYTRVEHERLVQFAWVTEPKNLDPAIEDEWYSFLPPESAVLTDYYTHSRDASLTRASLCQILRDASHIQGAKHAYICVSAENLSLLRAVEEIGFTYRYSLFKSKALGKVKSWSNRPEPLNTPGRKAAQVVTSPTAKS